MSYRLYISCSTEKKTVKNKIKAILATLGCTFAAFAGDPYSEITEQILANDPAIRAERASAEARIQELRAENSPEGPEAEFSYKFGDSKAGFNKWDLGVSQSFDWPGVYSARRKAADARRRALDFGLKAYRKEREALIREELINYVAARNKASVLEKFGSNVDSLYKFARVQYEHEQLTVLDFRKIGIETELARSRAETARLDMDNAADRIRALNGNRDIDLSILTGFPANDCAEIDLENTPTLAAARWDVQAAESMASAARRSRLPGFSLGYVHEREGSESWNGFSVGLKLNLWKGGKESAAAAFQAEAAREARENAIREIKAEFSCRNRLAQSLENRARDMRKAIGNEGEYRRLLTKALEGGTITVREYFIELNTLLEAVMEAESLEAQAAIAAESVRKFR